MSRFLVLSDIHANLEALEAVLSETQGLWDRFLVLGDTVDYGPDPDAVVAAVRALGAEAVLGNHDAAVLGIYDTSQFRREILPVVEWTTKNTGESAKQWLQSLPERIEVEGAVAVHANLADPLSGYILSKEQAREQFAISPFRLVFFGHTHLCRVYLQETNGAISGWTPKHGETVDVSRGRFLMNPGSVGQPRNQDPSAFAALWDSERQTIRFLRVPYPVSITQEKMLRLGFPRELVQRLAYGV